MCQFARDDEGFDLGFDVGGTTRGCRLRLHQHQAMDKTLGSIKYFCIPKRQMDAAADVRFRIRYLHLPIDRVDHGSKQFNIPPRIRG